MAIKFNCFFPIGCVKFRRMMQEADAPKPFDLKESSPVFAQREIVILQGLVDGLTWQEFDARFDIKRIVLKATRDSIAARFSPNGHVGGIYLAIIEAIKQDKLDTSKLPREYPGQLTGTEIHFFVMQYKGKRASEVCESLGIEMREIPTYRNRISEKFGINNFFAAIACMARDNKEAGKL